MLDAQGPTGSVPAPADDDPVRVASYRSGVAARLAGIPVETLRVWERRYSVVGPRVSARGQRLYAATDVRRLALIKRLVDTGHPIGILAALPTRSLEAMQSDPRTLSALPDLASGPRAAPRRAILIGPLVSTRLDPDRLDRTHAPGDDPGPVVVGRFVGLSDAQRGLQGVTADVIVVEVPTLDDQVATLLEDLCTRCGSARALLLYRYAPNAVIRQLRIAGHEVARTPADAADLDRLVRNRLSPAGAGPASAPPSRRSPPTADDRPTAEGHATFEPPAPRFDPAALSSLVEASSTLYCECPRHVVDLLLNLGGFEQYSADCMNRDAEDAALHRDLHRTVGQARALMEDALVRLARAEGLALPAVTDRPSITPASDSAAGSS